MDWLTQLLVVLLVLTSVGLLFTFIYRTKNAFHAITATVMATLSLDAVLPIAVRVALVLGLAGLSLHALAQRPSQSGRLKRRSTPAVSATLAVVTWWLLEMANPNVLSIPGTLEGLRKSLLLLTGLFIGMHWATRVPAARVQRVIGGILAWSLLVALVLHRFFPQAERGVERSADMATATLGGEYRLAGLFAGPFHVGLAAAALLGLAVVAHVSGAAPAWLNAMQAVVAIASLLESEVRTAYVAAVVGVGVGILSSRQVSRRTARVGAAIVLASIIGAVAFRESNSVASLMNARHDDRFLGRFDSYEEGVGLVMDRAWVGYGTGSASDTADPLTFGTAIVSHNVLLKFAFEGGLVGLALVLVSAWLIWRLTNVSDGSVRGSARACLATMVVMGTTGSMVEALPVTIWLLVVAGAAISQTERERELADLDPAVP